MNKISTFYDVDNDMLYFNLGEWRSGYYEKDNNFPALLVKKERKTKEVIGFLIPDFSIRWKEGTFKNYTCPKTFPYSNLRKLIKEIAKEYNL